MGTLQLPDAFKEAYKDLESYPSNLLYQPSYRGALQVHTARLTNAAPRLFISNDADIHVPVRDMLPTAQGGNFEADKRNIFNDAKLREWLGDTATVNANGAPVGGIATREDPKCRFM